MSAESGAFVCPIEDIGVYAASVPEPTMNAETERPHTRKGGLQDSIRSPPRVQRTGGTHVPNGWD
jgi:hypothetical protein